MKHQVRENGTILWTNQVQFGCYECRTPLTIPFYFCPETKETYCKLCSIKAAHEHFYMCAKSDGPISDFEHNHLQIIEVRSK